MTEQHRPRRAAHGVTTLLFDVLGTVVDVEGSIRALAGPLLLQAGVAAERIPRLLGRWQAHMGALIAAVREGDRPCATYQQLRRAALAAAVAEAELAPLAAPDLDAVAAVIRRSRPWPEAAGALRALGRSFRLVALSDGDFALLVDLAAAGGLAWHGVLSGQFVRTYKPDPAVYRLALDLLAIAPARAMLVAAHPFDLRAAAAHGLATAYIARPGAARPPADDAFTLHAADFTDLARQLRGAA